MKNTLTFRVLNNFVAFTIPEKDLMKGVDLAINEQTKKATINNNLKEYCASGKPMVVYSVPADNILQLSPNDHVHLTGSARLEQIDLSDGTVLFTCRSHEVIAVEYVE